MAEGKTSIFSREENNLNFFPQETKDMNLIKLDLNLQKTSWKWETRCTKNFGQWDTHTQSPLNHSQETGWHRQNRWKQKNVYEFLPLFAFQSLNQSDLGEFTYFFPEEHTEDIHQEFVPMWPTPSGCTEYSTLVLCQQTLANSSIEKHCLSWEETRQC